MAAPTKKRSPPSVASAATSTKTSQPVTGASSSARPGITRVDVLLFVLILIWGVNFTVIKIALEDFHPLSFNAIRLSLASLLLIIAGCRRRARPTLEPKDLLRLIALGILGNCLYQVTFIEGIHRTLAGNTALIFGATPVFTTLLSAWLGHERLGTRSALGVATSFLGVSLIVLSSHKAVSFNDTLIGDLLILCCTLMWSVYTVGLQPLVVKYGHLQCTRMAMISGAIPLILISIPWLADQSWESVHPVAWGGLMFSGAGAIALCYVIWNYGVRRLGNTRTSAYSNLTPVVGFLTAWAGLNERPLPGQLAGMAAIFLGIYLTRSDRRNKTPEAASV